MVIVFIFVVSFACSAHTAIICTSRWSDYKTVEEVSYRYTSSIRIIVDRKVRYQCGDDNVVQFNTTWTTQNYFSDSLQVVGDLSETCSECGNNSLKLTVRYRRKEYYFPGLYWADWKYFAGNYLHLKSNCNKLYWTNWIETTNCETSPSFTSRRSCADCDGDALEQKYCDATGQAVVDKNCNHYWGYWSEAPICVTTGCNTSGERVKTRQCLYDDGREATDVKLCSNGDESAFKKEKCKNNTITVECVLQTSPETDNLDNTGFFVGIGVAIALIVILCILLVIVRCCHHKPGHSLSTVVANSTVSYPFAFTSSTKKTIEQPDNASQLAEINQQNPAGVYQFANPATRSANDQSFKRLNREEQNKLQNKPIAHNIALKDGSNAYKFEQASGEDVYVIETPDTSNVYDFATSADPNVYEVEDRFQHADSNLSTVHSLEDKQGHSNTYGSLQLSNDVAESMYFILER